MKNAQSRAQAALAAGCQLAVIFCGWQTISHFGMVDARQWLAPLAVGVWLQVITLYLIRSRRASPA